MHTPSTFYTSVLLTCSNMHRVHPGVCALNESLFIQVSRKVDCFQDLSLPIPGIVCVCVCVCVCTYYYDL